MSVEAKLGVPLSDDEYHTFVEPFEGLNRLQAIHASLHPDEIVEPVKTSSKTRLLEFPDHLSVRKVVQHSNWCMIYWWR